MFMDTVIDTIYGCLQWLFHCYVSLFHDLVQVPKGLLIDLLHVPQRRGVN